MPANPSKQYLLKLLSWVKINWYTKQISKGGLMAEDSSVDAYYGNDDAASDEVDLSFLDNDES